RRRGLHHRMLEARQPVRPRHGPSPAAPGRPPRAGVPRAHRREQRRDPRGSDRGSRHLITPGTAPRRPVPRHESTRDPGQGEPPMSILEIKNLHATVETPEGTKEILKGVDLTIRADETHAIMRPNGSGKSTLAYAVAGHPKYEITSGTVTLDGEDVLEMSVDERARAGLFLAMQYPVEVAGVTVSNFLRTAKTAIDGEAPSLGHGGRDVETSMEDLRMDPVFAGRSVDEGLSGGETRRHEIVQGQLPMPGLAILDETASGLDVDALRVVSEGI